MDRVKKIEKHLNLGLSGCSLKISDDGKKIQKKSSGKNYDKRLLSQISKQKLFCSFSIPNIKTPDIIEVYEKQSPVSFEMEYVSAIGYHDFLNHSSPSHINRFSDSLISYLEFLRNRTSENYTAEDFRYKCTDKITSIEKSLEDKNFAKYLKNRILDLECQDVPFTFCHGDLTLSNILFVDESFYFIDFLDSYIESWVIDIVKLKQDLYYSWNLSREILGHKNMRSAQSSEHIWKAISEKYSDVIESESFKILEALNFLRIYPYVKKEGEKKILDNIIKKLPLYEEFDSSDGRKIF